jgi:DNA-binding MarR family transcriptional regulator
MTTPETPADGLPSPSPWDDLDVEGSGLSVDDFLTTTVHLTANALRRTITQPYAEQFGLTMPEWRMLSVLAHARELPFAELVLRSATDKGQVSRTMRAMGDRGLVVMRSEAARKVTCLITKAGMKVYEQVMPVARRRQAEMIRQLTPLERRAVYGALRRLREICGPGSAEGE